MPAAEVRIDIELAHRLVVMQHPDLASLPIVEVGSGWDNAIFRLGESLALRFPRRAQAAALLSKEQRWLPLLGPRLPLVVPVPVRVGVPQEDFPWCWSVTPWIAGDTADVAWPDEHQGEVLAGFFAALHRPAPADAPINPVRGVPLQSRADAFAARAAAVEARTGFVGERIRGLWNDALAAPHETAPVWIHGDPHPRNVLVVEGCLAAVIDWGDLAQGDRAADLAAIWMVLPQVAARERAIDALPSVPSSTWARARGWAILYALIFIDAGAVNAPSLATIGARTLERLVQGP